MKKRRDAAAKLKSAANHEQELRLHRSISALMREFRLEPGMLAGSPYAGLHANDIELFELLMDEGVRTVQRTARAIGAPISTVSSALDRLEKRGLIRRTRTPQDRRAVCIELTPSGRRLAVRLREAHLLNCRMMLLRLSPEEREELLRLVGRIAQSN